VPGVGMGVEVREVWMDLMSQVRRPVVVRGLSHEFHVVVPGVGTGVGLGEV